MSNLDSENPTQELVPAVRTLTETDADDEALATLFDIDGLSDSLRVWQPVDLADVMRHQMAAPIQLDLFASEEQGVSSPNAPHDRRELPATFGDLFDDARPPLDLLVRTRQFAKACRQNADGRVPEEIAVVLYYLSILVARSRHGARITHLDDAALATGVRTILARSWLDDRSRRILTDGLREIDETEGQ